MRKYDWDEVGRMTACRGTAVGAKFEYRADGMRIDKFENVTITANMDGEEVSGYYDTVQNVNKPTSRYYYDGQMPLGEDRTWRDGVSGPIYKDVDWYGLGARGIEWQQHFDDQSDVYTSSVPVYDTHGNNVRGVSLGANGTYSWSSERVFDPWGQTKDANNPKQGYCASLGHRADDESGLVYMRARYYEPSTGRFVSEDREADGGNWFLYCSNNPLAMVDASGNAGEFLLFIRGVIEMYLGLYMLGASYWHGREARQLEWMIRRFNPDGIQGKMFEAYLKEASQRLEVMKKQRNTNRRVSAAAAILGYMMIIDSLLIDINLATSMSGLDILQSVFGQHGD
ncbi:MAG: RHS repeat-associated core domain-containing protein [Chthonomonadaceae bacterium]|nr:RHS repeat-associated core domain-containing protein [Chthonomonadaceae bacterium]